MTREHPIKQLLLVERIGHMHPSFFLLLKQEQRPRPGRLSWRDSLRKYFGVDPLLDRCDQVMHWTRRLEPVREHLKSGG